MLLRRASHIPFIFLYRSLSSFNLSAAAFLFQPFPQHFISKPLFLFRKMNLSELLGIILINKVFRFLTELLACQVETAVAYNVVAMKISAFHRNPVNFAAENILRQKSSYGALSPCHILGGPLAAKSWSAGVGTPYFRQSIVQINGGGYRRINVVYRFGICIFPAVKIIIHIY